jgi:hypothetical protein
VALQQHPGQIQPASVAAAQLDVEDHQVGGAAVGDHQRISRRRRFTDHGELRVGGEQLAQPVAHDRLPVDDHQAGGAARGRLRAVGALIEQRQRGVEYGVHRHGDLPGGIDPGRQRG